MPPTIGLQQVNRFTLARHGLLHRAWRDPVAAAGNLCGLHVQVRTVPALSLGCRLADFERRTLDDALYRQRSLVKRWVMRGTLHLVPTADLPVYHRALRGAWGKRWGRYLRMCWTSVSAKGRRWRRSWGWPTSGWNSHGRSNERLCSADSPFTKHCP
jgi:hypothetical protein